MSKNKIPGAAEIVSRRWEVAMRTLLAVVGGYAFSALCTASLALTFPSDKAQAVLGASMLSFTVYSMVVIWAFCARSLAGAWLAPGLLAVVPTAHILLIWGQP